jgi:hypothetical protein
MRHNRLHYLNFVVWFLFCTTFLAACIPSSGSPTGQAPATLSPLRVNITPAMRNYRSLLNQCAQLQPDIALFVTEMPAANLGKKESDLQLRLGLPNQGVDYAFQVGTAHIQFVVNSTQESLAIHTDQIRALFDGEITDWSQASGIQGAVHPWVYPDNNELELILKRNVMNGEQISPSASIATDPESMLQAIAQDDNAIGFLPSSWMTDTIHAIKLDNDLDSQLNFPVLALTETNPQGPLSVFIACLQKAGNKVFQRY